MSSTTHTDLLRHYDWVRGRARRLTGDTAAAEDLTQETFLKALIRPPERRNLRGWLDAVLRNVLRQDLRAAVRRATREEVAARPLAAGQAGTEAVHELLAETLATLEEPFRTALTLRYYEGLGIADIAHETRVPIDTARSRLRRGLARMRERLAARLARADRRILTALFAPLRRAGGHAGAPGATGLFVLSATWKLVLGSAVVLAGTWLVSRALPPDSPRPAPPIVAADEREALLPGEAPASPGTEPAPARAEDARVALGTVASPPEPSPVPSPTIERTGLVIDADSLPLGGVRVAFVQGGATVELTSEHDGRIAINAEPDGLGKLRCVDERFATILDGELDPGSEIEPVLVVAPAIELAGSVSDPAGQPLENARVVLALPDGFQRRFAHVLDASVERELETATDEDGRFALHRLPAVPGAELRTEKAGFEDGVRPAPLASEAGLRIELLPRIAESRDLLGRVVDLAGLAVPDALVAAAGEIVRTDARGEFVFSAEVRARAHELTALQPGYLPGRAQATETASGPMWPHYVELRLGGTPLEIHGRVVDGDGHELEGIRVWIADPTHFGVEDKSPAQVECLVGGARSPSAIEASGETIRSTTSSFWAWDVTDARGRFRLRGLLERDYRVKAMDMESLLHAERTDVAAGSRAVELTLPVAGGRRYAGVVRSLDGAPVAGAQVGFFHRAYRIEYGENTTTVWDASGPETVTDEDGRFAHDGLPENVWLYVSGEGVSSKAFFLDADETIGELELEVERVDTEVAHFRVELGDPARADRFLLLDGEGVPREVALVRGGARVTTSEPALVAGVSYVYAVREGRYELVLYLGDAEVARSRVALLPGEVNLLRP